MRTCFDLSRIAKWAFNRFFLIFLILSSICCSFFIGISIAYICYTIYVSNNLNGRKIYEALDSVAGYDLTTAPSLLSLEKLFITSRIWLE